MRAPNDETFYLVRKDILSDAIQKTIEAKKLIASGEVETVLDAVRKVGLSRSAFYKYKDGVFPFNAMMREKIIVISMNLEHRAGILSKVLKYIAETGSNVLTINQSIPLQGIANVAMSVDTGPLEGSITAFVEGLNELDGVARASIVGRG